LRKDLASLQGFDVLNNAPTDSDANQDERDYEQCTEIPKCRNCGAEFAGHNPAESCPHCGTTRWLADRSRSATETSRSTEGKR
jgi:predicted Zn-ribbon and HTH transcriptional regulator